MKRKVWVKARGLLHLIRLKNCFMVGFAVIISETVALDGDILAVEASPGQRTRDFLNRVQDYGMTVTSMTADIHDELMSMYQVLHHYALISLGVALQGYLKDSSIKSNSYTRSFRATMKALKRLHGNLEPILEIQKKNPHAQEARDHYLKSVQRLSTFSDDDKILTDRNKKFICSCRY